MGKKCVSLLVIIIILASLLAGCGKKANKQQTNPAPENQQSQSTGQGTGADQAKSEKSGSGIYNGEIDSNSVEIKFEGQDQAFRLSDSVKNLFEGDSFKTGDQVTFTYFEDQYKRLVITAVSKTK